MSRTVERRRAAVASVLIAAMSAASVASGCAAVTNEPEPAPTMGLDETVFRCSVEPVLARQCSYSACHGVAGAALRVYSPGKLREKPPHDLDESTAMLTEAEHHANYLSASGFRFGAVDPIDNLLVRKTLPATEGGYAHQGGAIFTSTGDAEWMAIHAWLAGTGRCP